MNLSINGNRKTFYVHSLITSIFLGPRPNGTVVNHKDGDTQNNAIANLEYITDEENQLHAIERRLHLRGEVVHGAKMNEEKVIKIRELYATGKFTMDALASEFGITKGTISPLIRGKTWAHVAMPKGMPQAPVRNKQRGRLTVDQVRDIRRLYTTGEFSQRVLAERFGVSQLAIHEVVTGKSHQNIE